MNTQALMYENHLQLNVKTQKHTKVQVLCI